MVILVRVQWEEGGRWRDDVVPKIRGGGEENSETTLSPIHYSGGTVNSCPLNLSSASIIQVGFILTPEWR